MILALAAAFQLAVVAGDTSQRPSVLVVKDASRSARVALVSGVGWPLLRAELLKAFPTQVRMFFKDYPLESIHPWAKAAAIGGRCVLRQKDTAFWEYHDAMFAEQEKITAENVRTKIKDFAKAKQLDEKQFETCLADKSAEAEVAKSVAEAQDLGVQSTPTLFINGRSIPGSVPWPNLKQIIDFEIGYQATAHNAGEQCCSMPVPSLLNLPKNSALPK